MSSSFAGSRAFLPFVPVQFDIRRSSSVKRMTLSLKAKFLLEFEAFFCWTTCSVDRSGLPGVPRAYSASTGVGGRGARGVIGFWVVWGGRRGVAGGGRRGVTGGGRCGMTG